MKVRFSQKRKGYWYSGLAMIALGMGVVSAQSSTYPDMPHTGPVPAPSFPAEFEEFNPPVTNLVPAADVPAIAEWTRSNGPGDTMALTGENLSQHTGVAEGRDTRFDFYAQGLSPTPGLLQRLDDRQCALTLSTNLPPEEMYLLWPRNEVGYGKPVAINQTEAWWVGPDIVSQEKTFSVYGRNLLLGGNDSYLYIEGYGWVTSYAATPYKADFMVPAEVEDGTYTVWAHNGSGREYGWSDSMLLTVASAVDWDAGRIINVANSPYYAKGDGSSDDYTAINNAIRAAKAGDTVFFPSGTYLMSDNFFPNNGVRYLGAGMDLTTIKPHPSNTDAFFLRSVDDAVFQDMTFASNNKNMKFWYGGGSQRVTLERVRFDQRENQAEYDTCLYFPTADHMMFNNCEFYQSDNMWFEEASQIFFDGCKFVGLNDLNTYITSSAKELSLINSTCSNFDESDSTNAYGWAIGRWLVGQGHGTDKNPMLTYFGGNTMTNLGPRFAAARFTGRIDSISGNQATISELVGFDGHLDTTMLVRREGPRSWQEATISSIDTSTGTITLNRNWSEAWYPQSNVGDLIEICDDVDANSGEIFMTESLPAVLRANPTAAESRTITFSSAPAGLSGHVVAIVAGKGLGQTRRIIGQNGTALTLDEDWKVTPDTGSLAIVGECAYRMVAYGNHFDGNPSAAHIPKRFVGNPAVQPYGMASDWIVDGNIMTDLRIGIADYLWMDDSISSHYDVTPNYFNYYANNTISNCYHGIWQNLRLHTGSTLHEDVHEVGTMFRGNIIKDSVHRAIDREQLGTSNTKPADVIYLTVFDANSVHSNTEFFHGRDGFHNQVWINNQFESDNGGNGLTDLNESSVVRDNRWNGFDSEYGDDRPGAILGLPSKVVNAFTTSVPVFNSGTDPLVWTSDTDADWVMLKVDGGTVSDENSTGTLVLEVDESVAPEEDTNVVITVTSESGQTQQMTLEYEASGTVPPPPDPPPAAVLTKVTISGPASVEEGGTAQYICTASYSDGSTTPVDPLWSENSGNADVNAAGTLSAGNVDVDETVTLSALYSGLTATYDVTIQYVPVVLTGIEISGPSSLNEETTAQYTCTAIYSDGSSATVVPTWSENTSYTTINDSGVLTAGNVSSDSGATITASFGGQTDSYAVTVAYVPPILTGIVVSGPAEMNEGSTAQYSCTANYSDGTSAVVAPSWNENSAYTTINSTGLLSAGNVAADQSVTVTATFGGQTDVHTVTIRYVAPVLTGIAISGPSSVAEQATAQYSCTAIYSDGTNESVVPDWNENSASASINSSGVLTAGDVSSDQSVIVTASYGGKSDTHAVVITYVPPVLTSLAISGPGSIEENTTAQYACTAHYSDGSSAEVTPSWSEDSAVASINGSGLLSAGNVASDGLVTVHASFDGKAATLTLAITAVGDQVIFPLSGFDGKTVSAELWDDVQQTMTDLGEDFEPEEIVIENVNPEQWYWLGLSEYDPESGEWILVQGRWIWM